MASTMLGRLFSRRRAGERHDVTRKLSKKDMPNAFPAIQPSHHAIRHAAQLDLAADRIEAREQPVGGIETDHHHLSPRASS